MEAMLQLINRVGNGFDVPRIDILVLKIGLAPVSQRNLANLLGVKCKRSLQNRNFNS